MNCKTLCTVGVAGLLACLVWKVADSFDRNNAVSARTSRSMEFRSATADRSAACRSEIGLDVAVAAATYTSPGHFASRHFVTGHFASRLIAGALPAMNLPAMNLPAMNLPAMAQDRREPMFDSRYGVPDWEMDKRFASDTFTFVRVRYSSGSRWGRYGGGYRGYRGRGGGNWATDYPDADLNFSYRLQQLTSLKVDPNPIYLDLTDEAIFDYPFLYMIEPGNIYLEEPEVVALRRYLLNGGFMMVDDFWGIEEWEPFERAIKLVFPDRPIVDLDLSHPIFHFVYEFDEIPQVPSIRSWERSGSATDRPYDPTSVTAHYRVIKDDADRIMMLICHNTDLGDGWEREGENAEYFHLFSEKISYPMGINIVTWAMSH